MFVDNFVFEQILCRGSIMWVDDKEAPDDAMQIL
jgi:hypothetical protein